MFRSLIFRKSNADEMLSSKLYCDKSFYGAFITDLKRAKQEVIIESPFITSKRTAILIPEFQKLISRGVTITINTRDPAEHDEYFRLESAECIAVLQQTGINMLFTDGHHRKLAIIDRKILWEGSLNILSQNASCEVMRRVESTTIAQKMIDFIRLNEFLG